VWRAALLVVLAALGAYYNSYSGQFLLDDNRAILANPSIRHLWPPGPVLKPPAEEGQTVGGRPLLNLSLAINYALNDTRVFGYHAANLAIHVLAALALLGILRRTFLLPCMGGRFNTTALGMATAITLLWTVHPVQTESVTYISQRAESMMGLFYLLTLYCVIRAGCHASVFGSMPGDPQATETCFRGQKHGAPAGDCALLRAGNGHQGSDGHGADDRASV
jgi:hypothetical protein